MDEPSGSSFSSLPLPPPDTIPHTLDSLQIIESVPSRTRSLLVSRHERYPPRVPLPSPDPTFYSRNPGLHTHEYFTAIDDLAKRLSILEPPERRYPLMDPRFDGGGDGTATPVFLTKEHLWKHGRPLQHPHGLMNSPKIQKRTHHVAYDGSEDSNDSGLHDQQRPPIIKNLDRSETVYKEDPVSPKVEPFLPREADLFTPDSVPWEYKGPSPSDSPRESVSVPGRLGPLPKPIGVESAQVQSTKRVATNPFPGPLRKIFFSGTKRPTLPARPKLMMLPATSSSSLPPILTPPGEHPHNHVETMQAPAVQTSAVPSVTDMIGEEPPKAAEEEDHDETMQRQRLRGHDDMRGYSHVAEDSLHALANSFNIHHDHLPASKSLEPSLGAPQDRLDAPQDISDASQDTSDAPRLSPDPMPEKYFHASLEEPHNIPLPESPISSTRGQSMEPSLHSVDSSIMLEPRPVLTSSRASKNSNKESVKREDEAAESAFNNPLCRMRTYDGRNGWKYVETGREWVDRIVGHNAALKYNSQLTERPPRPTFNTPLKIAHDGSISDKGQASDLAEPKQTAVHFQEPKKQAEALNKVMMDLELLLREAHEMARQAAEADKLQIDRERLPRITVAGDRRRSMAPPTKVAFVESDQAPSLSQFKKARTDTPFRRFSLAVDPSESRRSSFGMIDPLPEEPSESPSTSSDHEEKAPDQPGERDFAYPAKSRSRGPSVPGIAKMPSKEEIRHVQRQKSTSLAEDAGRAVRRFVRRPTIQPRVSSLLLQDPATPHSRRSSKVSRRETRSEPVFSSTEDDDMEMIQLGDPEKQEITTDPRPSVQLRGSSHGHNIRSHLKSFKGDTSQDRERGSARKQPIARYWSTSRKRIVAAVACMNTALLGVLIGIYAGEVPAIQYAIVDLHHYAILGNVFLYVGLAIPTLLCWPLPLLHGRKPYTLAALALLLPLQLPQGVAVANPLSRHHAGYRAMLLITRGLSGLAFGIANMNFQSTLLDLFGASLQSANPHQEVIHEHDARRQGGGMGVWLGIWSWCSIGSIAVGFFIGTGIITNLTVMWGFWVALILTLFLLIVNLVTPEVRRAKHRRSLLDVLTHGRREKRYQYGELTIHVHSTGAGWFGEELLSGLEISMKMLKQPGFAVLCLYTAWVYGQIVLVVVLLGALISRDYRYTPPYVGLSVFAIALGSLLAVPFQKASIFSRSRTRVSRTDSMTFEPRVTKSSHLIRRVTFMVLLPIADLAYALASVGPRIHCAIPTVFAATIGFLSNMAMAECYGLVMETFDTSDLQAGMIGRPRARSVGEDVKRLRTPFTCYPRISAAFSLCQGFGFLVAAGATGAGGALVRRVGAQQATGVTAAILLALTVLLTGVLWRYKTVGVIPDQIRRSGTAWEAVIIGQPSGKTRRMNVLEMGKQSRWTEIRRRNRLTFSEG